jgi:N-dimethylarginine dimethylaminohydrolase
MRLCLSNDTTEKTMEDGLTRRDLIKATGAAAVVAATGLAASPSQSKERTVSSHKPLSKANCFSEDGELKEVIFGRVDDLRLPDYDPIYDFTGPKTVSMLKRAGGKLFSEADPEWYKTVHDSIEGVVDFLEDRGIVVHRPREHTADELANFALQSRMVNNVYNRDSLVTIGNTLVESSFLTPERIRNKYAVRYVSMGLMNAGNRVISMPQPLDTYEHNHDESPIVEGGDLEIGDGHIYIGNSGLASNSLGVLWYKNAFPDWEVHEIKISTKRFPHQHLDCVMVTFSKWGCILVDDIIGGYRGLPEPLQKKKWIELKLEEATDKLANFIAINPEEVVMPLEAERLRKEVEGLRPRIKVHAFPYYKVGKIGGSLRCNTCPIYREG